jgi:hypothetical protein
VTLCPALASGSRRRHVRPGASRTLSGPVPNIKLGYMFSFVSSIVDISPCRIWTWSREATQQLRPRDRSSWAAQTSIHLSDLLSSQRSADTISRFARAGMPFVVDVAESGLDLLGTESLKRKETCRHSLLEFAPRPKFMFEVFLE